MGNSTSTAIEDGILRNVDYPSMITMEDHLSPNGENAIWSLAPPGLIPPTSRKSSSKRKLSGNGIVSSPSFPPVVPIETIESQRQQKRVCSRRLSFSTSEKVHHSKIFVADSEPDGKRLSTATANEAAPLVEVDKDSPTDPRLPKHANRRNEIQLKTPLELGATDGTVVRPCHEGMENDDVCNAPSLAAGKDNPVELEKTRSATERTDGMNLHTSSSVVVGKGKVNEPGHAYSSIDHGEANRRFPLPNDEDVILVDGKVVCVPHTTVPDETGTVLSNTQETNGLVDSTASRAEKENLCLERNVSSFENKMGSQQDIGSEELSQNVEDPGDTNTGTQSKPSTVEIEFGNTFRGGNEELLETTEVSVDQKGGKWDTSAKLVGSKRNDESPGDSAKLIQSTEKLSSEKEGGGVNNNVHSRPILSNATRHLPNTATKSRLLITKRAFDGLGTSRGRKRKWDLLRRTEPTNDLPIGDDQRKIYHFNGSKALPPIMKNTENTVTNSTSDSILDDSLRKQDLMTSKPSRTSCEPSLDLFEFDADSETSHTTKGTEMDLISRISRLTSNWEEPRDQEAAAPYLSALEYDTNRDGREGNTNGALDVIEDSSLTVQKICSGLPDELDTSEHRRIMGQKIARKDNNQSANTDTNDRLRSDQAETKVTDVSMPSKEGTKDENSMNGKPNSSVRSLRSKNIAFDSFDENATITLPRELIPYNRPGRVDYAIVLGSRLRNRNKNGAENDIPYLHVSGQRRCKAIVGGDGQLDLKGDEGTACQNCAVGMSNYCHGHRELEEEFFYRESKDVDRYLNESTRCIALKIDGRRCSNRSRKEKNYCSFHIHLEDVEVTKRELEEFDETDENCRRCVATDGGRCTFRAIGNSVFCRNHVLRPPNECVPVDVRKRMDEEDIRKSHSNKLRPETQIVTCKPALEGSLSYDRGNAQCKFTNALGDRCCFEEYEGTGRCRMHEGRLDDTTASAVRASNNGSTCVFITNLVQCQNRVSSGCALCPKHVDFKQKNVSMFDLPIPEELDDRSSLSSSSERNVTSSKRSESEESVTDNEIETEESSGTTEDSDSDSSISLLTYDLPSGVYSHSAFKELWRRAERFIGQSTKEIENSKRVRSANRKMDKNDTEGQYKAQYGRLLVNAMKKLMTILELRRSDVFLDIGHGIGNTCLHASFCIGCESRGIEVVASRHSIAEVFRSQLMMYNRESSTPMEVGKIQLRFGQLEDPQHKNFLTHGVTRVYVNNFNGVFADRSIKNGQNWFLDDYVAGLFALMAPGSIMITFHPLSLGLDRQTSNSLRKKHRMKESDSASFYEYEKVFLGIASKTVKWNQLSGNKCDIYVYKYRRLHQPHCEEAVFLCSNPECENAINETPIPASTQNEEGRYVINHCACKYSPKNLRQRAGRTTCAGDSDASAQSG